MKMKGIIAVLAIAALLIHSAWAWFVPFSAAPPPEIMGDVQQLAIREISSIQRAGIPLAGISAEQTNIVLYSGQAFTAQLNATNTLGRAIPDPWTGAADTYMTYAYKVTTFYSPAGAILNQSTPSFVNLSAGASTFSNISFTANDNSQSGRYFATIAIFEIEYNWNPNLGAWVKAGDATIIDSKSKSFVISIINAPAPQPSTSELSDVINSILGSIYNFIRSLLGI